MYTRLRETLPPLRLEDYDYALPPERIARHPPAERDGGRLLLPGPPHRHRRIRDLPRLLAPGDLLVVNDSRVLRARVPARRATGGRVEFLLLGAGPGPVEALARPARRLRRGEVLTTAGGHRIRVHERREDGVLLVGTTPEPLELMEAEGLLPLPPYLEREAGPEDHDRYQTVYARCPGSVAAPTAGLHLSQPLLSALAARGVELAPVTLHVGPGTFRPLRAVDLAAGRLHREAYVVPPSTVRAVARCRERGGRVVAVGTTSLRALEAATPPGSRVPRGGAGVTDLFIRPGIPIRCADGLLTNFHLPRSSLMVLVAAILGRDRLLAAYEEALREGYRFTSYGDAMLLL